MMHRPRPPAAARGRPRPPGACMSARPAAIRAARPMLAAAALLALPACAATGAIPPTHVSGRHLTTEHHPARFGLALEGAVAYCLARGLDLRHGGSDRLSAGRAVSRFECVRRD